jgi:hypothetical protein
VNVLEAQGVQPWQVLKAYHLRWGGWVAHVQTQAPRNTLPA